MKSNTIILLALGAFGIYYFWKSGLLTSPPVDYQGQNQISGANQVTQGALSGLIDVAAISKVASSVQPTISAGATAGTNIIKSGISFLANVSPVGVVANVGKAIFKLFS